MCLRKKEMMIGVRNFQKFKKIYSMASPAFFSIVVVVVGVGLFVVTSPSFRYGIMGELDGTFVLSNGSVVNMPFHARNMRQVMLAGEADLTESKAFLDTVKLHPFVSTSGKAACFLGFVEYGDSVIGTYNEFFVAYLAFSSPQSSQLIQYSAAFAQTSPYLSWIAKILGLPEVYLVVKDMIVDSELSVLAGREIWGYPKDMSVIQLEPVKNDPNERSVFDTHSITYANIKDVSGAHVLELKMDSLKNRYLPSFWIDLSGTTVTPTKFKSTRGRTKARCLFRLAWFNGEIDNLRVSEESELGKSVQQLAFKPLFWIDYWALSAVLHPPHQP